MSLDKGGCLYGVHDLVPKEDEAKENAEAAADLCNALGTTELIEHGEWVQTKLQSSHGWW